MDTEEAGRPLNLLIPKFLSFFKSPNETIRRYAISCVNQFILDLPSALLVNMETYLQVNLDIIRADRFGIYRESSTWRMTLPQKSERKSVRPW
jgi:hypothetical protein